MTNLKSGLSGCHIELLKDDVLRKYSSDVDYNQRLLSQIKKQSLFSHFILQNIETPRVHRVYQGTLFSFDMEYVSGFSFDEYFSHANTKQVDLVVDSLYGYFDFLIKNSRMYHTEVSRSIFEKKLNSMKDSSLLSHIREQIVDMHVPYSFCHGDLTFANIIFHSNRLYFIDFLDSFIDSYLIDFAKLKQDLFYFWNLKIQNINNLKIYQIYHYIWNRLEERYSDQLNTKAFRVLDVMNLLRIDPYLTDPAQRIILKTLVEKTELYEDLSSSHGREVITLPQHETQVDANPPKEE
tara:strand:+ start:3211 stop:4092 length:882 start_codon:yes stop_codon:yes gene_type:complete